MDWEHPLRSRQISEETRRSNFLHSLGSADQHNVVSFSTTVAEVDARLSGHVTSTTAEDGILGSDGSDKSVNTETFVNTATYSKAQFSRLSDAPQALTLRSVQDQNATTVLTLCRRIVQQDELKQPTVPRRTTSMTRPSKRKRHEDYVAFHRHSCQLFSSLDGTLAQMRLSTSSSSSSASSSLSSSTPLSPPFAASTTQDTSLDYNWVRPLLGPTTTGGNGMRALSARPPIKRPTLQRMHCSKPSLLSYSSQSPTPTAASTSTCELQPAADPSSSPPIPPQPTSKPSPPMITTCSTYSSQITLPLPTSLTPNLNPTSPTTIHWTSPATRRQEYAKIDAANSGFRLFLRKVFPRAMCRKVGGGRVGFWAENIDNSDEEDAKSVRRFRVSVEEEVISYCLKGESGVGDRIRANGPIEDVSTEKQGKILHLGEENGSVTVKGHQAESWADDGQQCWDEKASQCRTATGMNTITRSSSAPMMRHHGSQREPRRTEKERKSMFKRMLSCYS